MSPAERAARAAYLAELAATLPQGPEIDAWGPPTPDEIALIGRVFAGAGRRMVERLTAERTAA